MRMRFSLRARTTGLSRAARGWARRGNKVTAAATALVVVAALTLLAVLAASLRLPGPPVQRPGTAAGLPHRVPAAATIAGLDGDSVVPARSARARRVGPAAGALPAARRPRHAVPLASRPPQVRLGAHAARGHDQVRTLRPPAPAPVRGFSARTSRIAPGGASASRVIYQNADGTRTAMIYQSPVNYPQADGSWARIDTSLVPAAGLGTGRVMPSASSSSAARPAPAAGSPSPPFSPSPTGSPSAGITPASITSAVTSPAAGSPAAGPAAGSAGPTSSAAPAPSTGAGQAPGGWRERSAADPETFAPFADGSPLVVLPLGGTHSVGLAVQGAAHAAGTAQGTTVTYPGARPGADLRLVAGAGMVDEQVVLRSASAPDSWVFPLRLAGLHARTGPAGSIEFADAAGSVVAIVPHGLMTDSKIGPRSGDGARSTGVTYALTTAGSEPAIRMTLDRAWLDAPARVFPVTVDPSVDAANSNGTTYVESPFNADNSGGTEIDAGTYDGGSNVARSFLKFDGVASSLANDNVLGVRLGLFNSWSYSCSPRALSVYPVTSSWSVTGNKTYPGPSTGPAVGSKSFATGWVPLGSTVSPCPAAWEGIDLNQAGTRLVNGWTHGTTPDDGLALGASAGDSYAWKKFTSDNAGTGDPFLSVTYTPDGARYELASSQPVQQVSPAQNGEIAIRVTNTGSATWTPTNGYELSYDVYNSKGKLVASHPVFTPMPSSVAPGASVTVDAKVNELPVGSYAIDFDMFSGAAGSSPVSFLSQGIAPFAVGLYIPQPPPVVTGVYPPTGYISPTVTPELATTASSTTGMTITYKFSLTCQPLPGTTCPAATVTSGTLSVPYWTTPALAWNEPYTWTVTATTNGASVTVGPVTITPEVPQPALTSGLGGSSGQAFDPQSGNFTTSATDAAVAVAGPPLEISRTYNSLDPQAAGAFGAGWSSLLDAAVVPDGDGSGSVVAALPDGQQLRFGYNTATATYAAPMGSPDVLTHNSGGTWTLMDSSGSQYEFSASGVLTRVTDRRGLAQSLASNSAGEVTTVTDAASGRALHLTWSTPAGAARPHVASVTTDPPGSGQPGLTWAYSYTGDDLAGACAPTGGCTSYTYGTGSNYRSAVLDSGPRSYWGLGEASGAASAADEVDANLGTTSGTYSNVTLGAAGPLVGSSETAAGFNGTSSSVALPAGLIADQDYVSAGLWFKAASSTASGVLLGTQADALSNSGGNTAARDPVLYVGGNGKLYGELWNGSIDPMSSTVSVDDGSWHYAVITGSSTSQSLWLDGTKVATLAGQISPDGLKTDTVGAGFWGTGWPSDYATEGPSVVATPIGYFAGSIAQAAVYPRPLGQAAIAGQYALATTPSAELTQVTMPSGRVSQQVTYNAAQDRVATYTDPHGGQWQVHAPLATGYKASSDSLGEVTRYVTVTDPAGRSEVYGFDALSGGRLVSYSRGNGDAPETFGYDAAGFLNQVQDSDGSLVTFTNDIHGNVLSRTWYPVEPASSAASGAAGTREGPKAAASSSSCTVTGAACTAYYTYNYNGANPLDPRNNELATARDARSASATDSTYLTSYVYNAAGELTGSTTPATSDFPSGRTTSDAYSTASTAAYGGGTVPAGLLVSRTTPGGAATAYSYYSDGDLAQVTRPSGLRTVYTYDALGRALTSDAYSDTYPAGLTTSYAYNGENQPVTVTHPGVASQVTGVTHTLQDSYAYDSDGNLTQLAQADLTGGDATRTTTYTYNDHGEQASVTDPAGGTTGYSYNDSGNVTTVADAAGNEHDYAYNEYGEVTQDTLTTNSTSQATPGGGSLVLDSYAYDPAGLLAAATDAMGRTTNYFYNGNEELIATQNLTAAGTGRQTAYTYDGAGNLIETDVSADPVAQQTITDYTVDAADRVTSVAVDPTPAGSSASGYANRTTAYTYNADNDVTAQTVTGVGGSAASTSAYDTSGDLTSHSVQDGSTSLTTRSAYDELGQPTSMISPDGNAAGAAAANFTTSYAYDQAGNLAALTGPPVATQTYAAQTAATTRPVTSYGYDTFGGRTQSVDPDGNTTTTGYDADGRISSVARPSYTPPGASAAITATTSYSYDGLGNRTSVTDPRGNVTRYAYDALGDVTSQTDPQLTGQSAAGVWAYTYDNDGERLSATSPTGAVTQATYDTFGDQLTATRDVRSASGTQANTTTATYDYLGDPLTTTTPDGAVTTDTYDHLGELASTADGYGDTTSYGYNYAGQTTQVTHPDGTSGSLGYDAAGNLTSVTAYGSSVAPALPPVLATQTFNYDSSGNRTSSVSPAGNTTTDGYNAAGELTSQTQPVSASASDTTSYGYDPAGNQTAITGGRGNTNWTTYNAWSLPESVVEPATPAAPAAAQRTWTTSYNAGGQAASVTQPGGVSLTYGYDQLGDLASETGSGAAATPAQSLGYNTDGQLTSASAPGGTNAFTYNDAGNLTAATGPSGNSAFTYNGDGLLTSRADAAGTTSYGYDKADRPATVADPLTGSTLSYAYNADSLPSSVSYAKGGTAGPTQSYAYNGLQQLTGDTLTSAAGGSIASATYGYNSDGDLTSQATTGYAGAASTSYAYNEADQLTTATTGSAATSYAYDADGNLTQAGATTSSYNNQDQLTRSAAPAGTTSYSYTLNGALSAVTPPSGGAQNYTSNAYGQTATAPGGISYAYDALGRLATRSTSTTTATLAYSGAGSTLASDGTTTYSHDPADGLVGSQAAGGTAQSALTDIHGDVTGTFSPAAGTTALTASAAYSPYGTVTATTGTMPALGYQGQYTDPATGSTDMSARWYSPATGSFTSNDTVGGSPIAQSLNASPYGYAAGNPLTNQDPTGHLLDKGGPIFEMTGNPCLFSLSGMLGCPLLISIALYGGYVKAQDMPYETPWAPARQGCSSGCGPSIATGAVPFDNGDGSQGCGVVCVGIGVAAVCLNQPELCVPVPPPPPPPPPQDCYAGLDPSCHPPAAPPSLRNGQYESQKVRETTNPRDIPHNHAIEEPTPTEEQLLDKLKEQTSGINVQEGENGSEASGQGSNANASAAQDPTSNVGNPATPEATSPESGSSGGGSGNGGAGNPPATTPTPPEPAAPEPGPGSAGASGGAGTVTVTETAANSDEGLSGLQKAGIGAVTGAVTNVAGSLVHGEHNPEKLLRNPEKLLVVAGIGAATGAAGGPFGVAGATLAAAANSVGTQLYQSHTINPGTLAVETALGGLTGGADPLAKALGVSSDVWRAVITGVAGLPPAVCDPGNAFLHQAIC